MYSVLSFSACGFDVVLVVIATTMIRCVAGVAVDRLTGDRSKYFTYSGSLTTPPCFESVRFLIFNDAIELSEEQV